MNNQLTVESLNEKMKNHIRYQLQDWPIYSSTSAVAAHHFDEETDIQMQRERVKQCVTDFLRRHNLMPQWKNGHFTKGIKTICKDFIIVIEDCDDKLLLSVA